MSNSTEPVIDPVVETPAVSTEIAQAVPTPAVVEEPVVENIAVVEEPPVAETEEEESTAIAPATEEVAAKPTTTKRRTIFNPFGKSSKKEEIKDDATTVADEPASLPVTEEKVKKPTKAFGFFSRSKSTPKVSEEETFIVEAEPTTELPQIEHLQPIENVTGSETEATDSSATTAEVPTIKETVAEITEKVEHEANEVAQETEQSANNLTTSVANKRQSFISKLFGGNKSKKQEKEVASAEEEAPVVEADTTTTTVATEEITEQQTEEEEVPANQRPSSPLGRLTGLFSKKNDKKAAKEEAPAVIITDVEQDVAETTIEENANVTATPVVTASA